MIRPRLILFLALLLPLTTRAQSVTNSKASDIDPKESDIDVVQRHEQLAHPRDPRLSKAIASLGSCVALPEVAPPTGGSTTVLDGFTPVH